MKLIIKAIRARIYYKRVQGYDKGSLPCLRCVWEHEPEDTENPWQWILCHECDWGNT